MLFDDDNWKLIHQSIPPFRWVANAIGSIGSWAILKCAIAEEDGKEKLAAVYGYIYSLTLPTWQKYGSYYKLIKEIDEYL